MEINIQKIMKAVVVSQYGGPEVLEYKDVAMPVPGDKQVLIRVEAAGVNFADNLARQGTYLNKEVPFIPGNEVAGIIVDVGNGVNRFRTGERVIAFPTGGAYAEYALADEALTYAIPDSLDMVEAAACPVVGFTAYLLLAGQGKLQNGETVLIHSASGGVGTTAIQIARILGAGMVIGTVGSDEKKIVAREAGADHVINYQKENFADAVLELTKGKGAHIILDSIGGSVTNKSLQCLADYGRLVNFGNASGEEGSLRVKDLRPGRSVIGFSLSQARIKQPQLVHHTANQVLGFLNKGKLRIVVENYFHLKEANTAHELIGSRQSRGKILLIPPKSSLLQRIK